MYTYRCDDGHTFNSSDAGYKYYINVEYVGYFYFTTSRMCDRAAAVEEAKGYKVYCGSVVEVKA